MDIKALLDYLKKTQALENLAANPLTQWGPKNRRLLGANFLPPKPVMQNEATLDRVRFRTVVAVDGTRYDPAQKVDGGELYGKIRYTLGHSDLTRELTGPDYDGIVNYLARNLDMAAAGKMLGFADSFIVQALVEHDELMIWEAITKNTQTRRGDNGYFEYIEGPSLDGFTSSAGCDWTDAETDPWTTDIVPKILHLQGLGYDVGGIRVVTSYAVLQTLADHPATANRLLAPLITGQTISEAIGIATQEDVKRLLINKYGVKSVDIYDLRAQTKTGEKRFYPADGMTFIASTGLSEEIIYNTDDPSQVKVVDDVVGFLGIGTPNGASQPGRKAVVRSYTGQKDARLEFEGWQCSGPVLMEPTAITNIDTITTGTVS